MNQNIQQSLINNNELFQNESWKNLKLYLEQFIKINNISYSIFLRLVSNNDNLYITSYQMYKL